MGRKATQQGDDEEDEDHGSEDEEDSKDARESRVEYHQPGSDVWVLWKPTGLSTNEGTQISTLSASLHGRLSGNHCTQQANNKDEHRNADVNVGKTVTSGIVKSSSSIDYSSFTDEQLLSMFRLFASYYNHSIPPPVSVLHVSSPITVHSSSLSSISSFPPTPQATDPAPLESILNGDERKNDPANRLLMVFQLRRGIGGLVLGCFDPASVAQLRHTWCEMRWVMVVDGLWSHAEVLGQDVKVLISSRSWSCEYLSLVETTSRVLLRDDGVNTEVKRLVRAFRVAGHPILGKSLPGCHALRGNAVRGTQIALLGLKIGHPYNITCEVDRSYVGKLERLLERERRRYETESLKVQQGCDQLSGYLCSLQPSDLCKSDHETSEYESKMLSFDLPRLEQDGTRQVLARASIGVPSPTFCELALKELLAAYVVFAAKDANVRKRLLHAPHESRRLACFLNFELISSPAASSHSPSSALSDIPPGNSEAHPQITSSVSVSGSMTLIGGAHCEGSPVIRDDQDEKVNKDTQNRYGNSRNAPNNINCTETQVSSKVPKSCILRAVNFNQNREDHSELVGLCEVAELAGTAESRGRCSLFITHWPCVSCLGAIVQFRVLFPHIVLEVDFEGWKEFQSRLRFALTQ